MILTAKCVYDIVRHLYQLYHSPPQPQTHNFRLLTHCSTLQFEYTSIYNCTICYFLKGHNNKSCSLSSKSMGRFKHQVTNPRYTQDRKGLLCSHLLYPFGSRVRLPLLQVRGDLEKNLLARQEVVVGSPRETVTGGLRGSTPKYRSNVIAC